MMFEMKNASRICWTLFKLKLGLTKGSLSKSLLNRFHMKEIREDYPAMEFEIIGDCCKTNNYCDRIHVCLHS